MLVRRRKPSKAATRSGRQGDVDVSIAARMGDVFALAKQFTDMSADQWRSCRAARCTRCESDRSASWTSKPATSARRRNVDA